MRESAGSPRRRHPTVKAATPVGDCARAALAHHLQALQNEERRARHGGVEAIHQLRVATRRLRATLTLFEPVLPLRAAKSLEGELAWLADVIGEVRDLDVLMDAVAKRGGALDPSMRPAVVAITRHVAERRAAAFAALGSALDTMRMRRLVARIAILAESGVPASAQTPCGVAAPALVKPLVRTMRRAGDRLDDDRIAETLHRLRVRAKRVRYALESLEGLGAGTTRRLHKRLVRLQEHLGDHHDAVTQRAWLRGQARTFVGQPEVLLALGALLEALHRRARKVAGRARAAWARVDRSRLLDGALTELGAPASKVEAA